MISTVFLERQVPDPQTTDTELGSS